MVPVSYWAFLGTFYLLLLTYQDYKNNMLVDERRNYFMMGVTVMLLPVLNRSFWYVIFSVIVVYFMGRFLNKYKVIGLGDVQALGWMFAGFLWLSVGYFVLFVMVFLFCYALWFLFGSVYARLLNIRFASLKLPFFGVLTISFVITCLLFNLY